MDEHESLDQPVDPEPEKTAMADESTGDVRVDEALTRLTELDAAPVHAHADVIEDVHQALQDTLAEGEA